jgi:hypothetical protein
MSRPIEQTEAQFALDTIARRRQQVLAEIDVPPWYWCFVAGGWVVLGVITTFAPGWAAAVATVLFGAAHATIAPRVITGRRGSRHLSIRAEVVGRRVFWLIIGFLLALVAVTVGLALLLDADGTQHPSLWASTIVAVIVLIGGPALMAWVRRRAERAPA